MFEIRGSATIATMSDLKTRTRETVDKAASKPVYLLRDGEPVAGIVSIELLEILQDALEDRYVSGVARERLRSIRDGADALVDEAEFWARADALMAERG